MSGEDVGDDLGATGREHDIGREAAAVVAVESAESDAGVESVSDADTESGADAESESGADAESESDAESGAESELDPDVDEAAAAAPAVPRRKFPLNVGRRGLALGLISVVAVGVIAFAAIGERRSGSARPAERLPIDVWAPYWTLDDVLPDFRQRVQSMRDVSPFWFSVTGPTTIASDEFAALDDIDEFERIARDAGVHVIPSIRDELDAGEMAAILSDTEQRAAHIDALLEFAVEGDYEGIDLDYERFAFSDGRSTWSETSPDWVAFIEELGARLHDDGRTLTVSIPPLLDGSNGDTGYWVYDHGAIAEHVDRIRIMAYDFSTAEAGPIAPLEWVSEAIAGTSAAVPEEFHDRLVLGIPTYGYNWPISYTGICPETAEGRTGVNARSVDDLIARRDGTPVYDETIGEWSMTYELVVENELTSCVQSRMVRWVDAEGALLRIDLAREAGWGGVALWALGYDDDAVWTAIAPSIQR